MLAVKGWSVACEKQKVKESLRRLQPRRVLKAVHFCAPLNSGAFSKIHHVLFLKYFFLLDGASLHN